MSANEGFECGVLDSVAFGVELVGDGIGRFRLWAPALRNVHLAIEGRDQVPMERRENGWFEVLTPCRSGDAYGYWIEGNLLVPDPAARAVRSDARSLVYDRNAYRWRTNAWKGRPWREAVIYELHVGLSQGFAGVVEMLPRLAELGVTAIELMPVSAFPGRHNWGYDGVLPFAPSPTYGDPDELKALVDRAHELGLMVLLDVVYNHFGPEGNYIGKYAPSFFRDDLQTPWGPSIDFSTPEVRQFFTENALYWLEEFRFDGLRFDAAHAITHPDWLDETAARIRKVLSRDRLVHLVLENDNNVSSHMRDGYFSAQWNDDAHHVVHVLLSGERRGYYADYVCQPGEKLARSLSEGFIFQEREPAFPRRGSASCDLSPQCFVFFLQNHDQVGNRAFGERLTILTSPRALEAAIVLQLLAPHIPLIFMGEEDASTTPFYFFSDLSGAFADAVREGRKLEFLMECDDPPDPSAIETFVRSLPLPDGRLGERRFRFYQRLLALRRLRICPHIEGAFSLGANPVAEKAVVARWRLGDGSLLTIAINLGDLAVLCQAPLQPLLFESCDGACESLKSGLLAPSAAVAFLSHPADDIV